MDEMCEPGIDLDFNSDYVDATSEGGRGNQKNIDEEFHDAPELKDSSGDGAVYCRENALNEHKKSLSLNSRNISFNIVSPADGECLSVCSQGIRIEKKLREPTINLKHLLQNLYEVGGPSPVFLGMGLKSSNKHLEVTDKVPNEPKKDINSNKEVDSMNKENKLYRKIIPVSRQRLSEKASLGFQFKNPSLKRTRTLTAACFDEIAKGNLEGSKRPKQNEGISQKRSYSGLGSILQKKLKRITVVNKKEDFQNDSALKSRKTDCSLHTKFGSKETRMVEVEKRIGATMLNSCIEKSTTSLKTKGKDTRFFSNLNNSPTRPLRRLPSTPTPIPKENAGEIDKYWENTNSSHSGNFNNVEISLVEVRKEVSPMSSTDVMNASDSKFLGNISSSEAAANTQQTTDNEDVLALRKEKEEYLLSNVCLKKDNESLKEIIAKQQKKECDLKKEIIIISEELSKSHLSLKEMENKFVEKDSTIAQLRCCINKLYDVSEKLKHKNDLIADFESKNSRMKSENNRIKKELDKKTVEQNNWNKDKESLMNVICQLRKERDSLESKISNLSGKIIEKEQENINLLNVLSTEREQLALLREKRDINSSSSVVNLSEQLLEKGNIISELEKLRDGVQLINKEVCCMLSSVFKELGLQKPETEVEFLISSGRVSTIKNSLISLIANNRYSGLENRHDECRNLIFNLEDRAAVLEAELEESKKYSETLAGVIAGQKIWDRKYAGLQKGEVEEKEGKETGIEKAVGDTKDLTYFVPKNLPQNLFDLFVILEGKQQNLRKMEKRVKELEEVHANCKRKRVRNEMRIDQLEMALAAVKLQY